MVKFANKAKGRPTKRKTLKLKFKIQRKVKQHKKRVRKEAKKLSSKGIHVKKQRGGFLPNMFPFKQQILQNMKKSLPTQPEPEITSLDQSEYGLINIQNKCAYLPKPKDNLIKKYVTNLDKLLEKANIVLELLDVRNPDTCIDATFRQNCNKKGIKIISILTKTDTVKAPKLLQIQQSIKSKCTKIAKFSTDHKVKSDYLQKLVQDLKQIGEGTILVAGKSLTGKHTFITHLAKTLGKYQESPYDLKLIKITPSLSLIDSPYKINDTQGSPFFSIPNPILEQSLISQQEALIRRLFIGNQKQKAVFKKQSILIQYETQDYTTVSDFVTKVGRSLKMFGKGGSIDTSRVRAKLLTDWFTGNLNSVLLQ